MGLHNRREREAIMREIRSRRGGPEQAFVRSIHLDDDVPDEALGHAADVPAARALRDGLDLHPRVTFLVGENGSGKSTIIEALAVACGMNPEGGGRNLRHETRASHAPLGEHLRVVRGVRTPRTDFFLRAESVYTTATELERLEEDDPRALVPYGGKSLHERSHGESFLAIVEHRLGPDGLYLMDEPEAALSPRNVLVLLRRIAALVADGAQVVIATHSPVLTALPDAAIVLCDDEGLRRIEHEEVPSVALTRSVLDRPDAFLRRLLADDADDQGRRDELRGREAEDVDRSTGGPADDEAGGFVRELCLDPRRSGPMAPKPAEAGYVPWIYEAVRVGIPLHPGVTFLVGENGGGKSSLAEAIAVAMKMNGEGGAYGWYHTTRRSHGDLGDHVLVVRGRRDVPRNRFFLRAEGVFTLASAIDDGANVGEGGLEAYGGVSLHEQSHGESFLALVGHRFGRDGFYVLDEPEAALSAQNQLTLLRMIHELVRAGSQLVIATHSPLLLTYPDRTILRCGRDGVREVEFDDVPAVAGTRAFLADPRQAVEEALRDG
jgi:predicted ATPase